MEQETSPATLTIEERMTALEQFVLGKLKDYEVKQEIILTLARETLEAAKHANHIALQAGAMLTEANDMLRDSLMKKPNGITSIM